MRENALRCIANTHREEGSDRPDGGWTINRNDRGNWTGGAVGKGVLKGTKFGIAANTYPHIDIKNLTREQADAIYIRDYWAWAWGDAWPTGLDQVTYDATVNSGSGRGPKWTCQALGFAKADLAATKQAHALPTEGRVAAVKKACAIRMSFLRSLTGPSGWPTFGRGWGGRVQRMEAIGVKMTLQFASTGSAAGTPTKQVEKHLEKEAEAASKKSTQAGTGGVATGGAAGGTTATDAVSSFDWTAWLFAGSIVLVVLCACAWLWFKHRERAKAYLDAARGLIG